MFKVKKYIFFYFPKIFGRMEEHGKKFRRPCKKSGNVGSMEEAVEEEKLKNIFSFIFQNFLEEWKKLGKKFKRPAKLWKCWTNGRNCGRRK